MSGGYYGQDRGALGNSRPKSLGDTGSSGIDDFVLSSRSMAAGKLQAGNMPVVLPPDARLSTTRERFSLEERHVGDLAAMAREVDQLLMSSASATSPVMRAMSATSLDAESLISPRPAFNASPLFGGVDARGGDGGQSTATAPSSSQSMPDSGKATAENGQGPSSLVSSPLHPPPDNCSRDPFSDVDFGSRARTRLGM